MLLVGAGTFFGAYGALIGAGGGFLIVPFLLLVNHLEPHLAAGTSLVAVFMNALSGSISYGRQHRIDIRSGSVFALATIPGAVIGSFVPAHVEEQLFRQVFGVLLLILAGYLILRPGGGFSATETTNSSPYWGWTVRRHVTGTGRLIIYSFSWSLGLLISFIIGFLSSFFGIGGGVVQVPALVTLLHFPPHVATATSLYIMVFTAGAGSLTYALQGHVLWGAALALGAGVLIGGPIGAALSKRVRSQRIMQFLALALAAIGVRLVWG